MTSYHTCEPLELSRLYRTIMAMPLQPPSRLLATSMLSLALRFLSKGNVCLDPLSRSCDSEIDREVSQAGNVCRSASIELTSISLLCSQHSISLQHVSRRRTLLRFEKLCHIFRCGINQGLACLAISTFVIQSHLPPELMTASALRFVWQVLCDAVFVSIDSAIHV